MSLRPAIDNVDPLAVNLIGRVCIGDVLTRSARHFGDRLAVVDGEFELSYRQLESRANSVARGLSGAGVERGDAVTLVLPNCWQFLATFFGCAKLGAAVVPVNLGLAPTDIAFQLDDTGPRVAVVEESFLPLLEKSLSAAASATSTLESIVVVGGGEDHPAEVAGITVTSFDTVMATSDAPVETFVDDRDVVQCLYTSGTTSRPKAVLTSHTAVTMAALSACLQFRHERGDRYSVFPIVLPLFHVTALDTLTLPVLLSGGTVLLHRGFDPEAILRDVATRQVTHLMLLPIMWGVMAQRAGVAAAGCENVRMAVYAMAPMSQERLSEVRVAFPNADVVLGSGQTEFIPPTVMQWPSHQWQKFSSWGAPVATTDVQIMNADGRLLPPGEEGEIVYRGPQAMQGYHGNEDANTVAFAHGWFHSGDVGYLDEDGVLWFTDRLKDIVKSGGENVSSVEVERVLLAHPDVADCAVVGTPDDRWGEAVTAVVVPGDGVAVDVETLRSYAKQHLAGYKVPKRFVAVEQLPKTTTGKIQKHELRARIDTDEG
ncbi:MULTISPECIES: AMP-binding protein [unclassified Pseudonocardia]|uniref:class I adenylate-forming enzyme family protein n=1 Tax=unclassified Pseudonocardia TaxID=2619320 RepID=UPI0001FFE9D4|nr:AMP-binding protein [Pseudonocardia sp. Ae707_Ps1]OLM09020.1 O-succinylbenzoic acid--CoA ligase [Pseudonocardia sp. Ae707_Ps1]